MIKLEINPLDQKDIIELLDYAKEQKKLNKPILKGSQRWDDTKYWNYRIEYLKKVILREITYRTQVYKSSMDYDTPQEVENEE